MKKLNRYVKDTFVSVDGTEKKDYPIIKVIDDITSTVKVIMDQNERLKDENNKLEDSLEDSLKKYNTETHVLVSKVTLKDLFTEVDDMRDKIDCVNREIEDYSSNLDTYTLDDCSSDLSNMSDEVEKMGDLLMSLNDEPLNKEGLNNDGK